MNIPPVLGLDSTDFSRYTTLSRKIDEALRVNTRYSVIKKALLIVTVDRGQYTKSWWLETLEADRV